MPDESAFSKSFNGMRLRTGETLAFGCVVTTDKRPSA